MKEMKKSSGGDINKKAVDILLKEGKCVVDYLVKTIKTYDLLTAMNKVAPLPSSVNYAAIPHQDVSETYTTSKVKD